MSSSKDKGTRAETAIARFLQAVGFEHAERRALSGTQDRGDIAGLPGIVIEVKNCARQELAAWVTEAETERDRDGASLGVVWHKRRGKADPRDWFVTMSGLQFAHLLREHMELPPLEPSTEQLAGGTQQCGHDDYHDAHEWADQPHIWCPGYSTDGGEAAA
jgi:hypothetical protein